MATCSGALAWKTPWTEEPGGVQSTGLPRGGTDEGAEHAAQTGYSSFLNQTSETRWRTY